MASHSPAIDQHRGHSSRREFFIRAMRAALAGASVLEISFFRAAIARAQAPNRGGKLFDIQKVADGVYCALAHPQALTNCNAAIFVNSQDVLVVDAHSKPSAAAALIAQIRDEVTTKPVRYLVNTHFHWDHTQGDPAYRSAGGKVQIIASEETKQLIAKNGRNRLKESLDGVPKIIDGLQARLAKATSAADREFYQDQIRLARAYEVEMKTYAPELPDISFDKSHVITDRAHDLHIEFHGRAHTAGDVVVFCPQKRAVATGDVVIGFLPNIADGYPREWPGTIDSIARLPADKILPGHGEIQRDHERLNQLRNYIVEITTLIEAGKKAGKPVEEMKKAITISSLSSLRANGYGKWVDQNLSRFSVYLGSRTAMEDRLGANIETIYNRLDRV